MRDQVAELRSASAVARSSKQLVAVLDRALADLCALDLDMVDGMVVPKPTRDALVAGIGEVANETFERLRPQRERAQAWLAEVPEMRRPRCFDLSPWHRALDVPSETSERLSWQRSQHRAGLDAHLSRAGGDAPATVEGIERLFQVTLPEPLRVAWRSGLARGKRGRFVTGTLRGVLVIADNVSREQLAFESVAPAPPGKPYPVIPFYRAHSRRGESDYLSWELATDRVVTCQHDSDVLGPVWPSVDAWLASRRRPRREP
jgi:hypothetical protein